MNGAGSQPCTAISHKLRGLLAASSLSGGMVIVFVHRWYQAAWGLPVADSLASVLPVRTSLFSAA